MIIIAIIVLEVLLSTLVVPWSSYCKIVWTLW